MKFKIPIFRAIKGICNGFVNSNLGSRILKSLDLLALERVENLFEIDPLASREFSGNRSYI